MDKEAIIEKLNEQGYVVTMVKEKQGVLFTRGVIRSSGIFAIRDVSHWPSSGGKPVLDVEYDDGRRVLVNVSLLQFIALLVGLDVEVKDEV